MNVQPILVSVPEAMRILGIGRTKLYELIGDGKLQKVSLGAKSLIDV